MGKEIGILLVGAEGFGRNYVNWLGSYDGPGKPVLRGVVNARIDNLKDDELLKRLQPSFYTSMEDFYKDNSADLAIIATPIHMHREHVTCAISNGSNVLCEKPAAGSLEDALYMADLQKKSGKLLGIGFQWSYDPTTLAIKKDIQSGVWGKPVLLKTIVLWPRNTEYYSRWTGKKFAADGRAIMDSVTQNGTAHYLQNMLFLLGDKLDTCADIVDVRSYLYRANDIETFDTAQIKLTTRDGATLLYYASHSPSTRLDPVFEYRFEKGTIMYTLDDGEVVGYFNDGTVKKYGPINGRQAPLHSVMGALDSGTTELPCTIHTALTHMRVMDVVNSRIDDAYVFEKSALGTRVRDGGTFVFVPGLANALLKNYYSERFEPLFTECGVPKF